jgi:ketopantoate reductase
MHSNWKILVAGWGAFSSVVAGLFGHAGRAVTLSGRGRHIDANRNRSPSFTGRGNPRAFRAK